MGRTRLMLIAAISLGAAGGSAGAAAAQTALQPVLERLAAQGYGAFEVEREGRFLKIEAHREGFERELRYNVNTGALVRDREQRSDDRVRAGASPAELSAVYDRARAMGLSGIEIDQRGGRIKVEGVRDGIERELFFDARTGALLSDRVDDDDRGRDRDRDRTRTRSSRDDDRGDRGSRGRDRDDDDDDDDDDDRGRDRDRDRDRGGSGVSGGGGSGGNSGSGRGNSGGGWDDDDDDDDRGGGRGRGGDEDDDDDEDDD